MNNTTECFLSYLAYKKHCMRIGYEYVSFAEWIDAWSWDEEWHEDQT